MRHFPWNVTRLLDPLIAAFCDANTTWDEVIFHGKGMEKGMEIAKQGTIDAYVAW